MVKRKPKKNPQKKARGSKFTRQKKKAKIDLVASRDEHRAGPSQFPEEILLQSSESDLQCDQGLDIPMIKSPSPNVTVDDAKSTELDNEAAMPSQQFEGNGETEPSQHTVPSNYDYTNSPTTSLNIPAAEDTVCEGRGIYSALFPDFQSGNGTSSKDGVPKSVEETLLEEVRKYLLLLLPDCWVSIVRDGGIHIGLWAKSKFLVVQRSMFFDPNGTTSIFVHGKELPRRHKFWQDVKKVVLEADSVKKFVETIVGLARNFRLQEICAGVQHSEDQWEYAKECTIDNNDFHETRYATTCRSKSCLLVVPNLKTRRCEECGKLDRTLSKRKQRRLKNDDIDVTPRKTKPHSALCTPERKERMHRQSKKIKSLRESNIRLKKKIALLTEEEGLKISCNNAT